MGDWLAALSITALALVVRVLGIRFGLPWYHHWDEGWITDSATHMLQTRGWEPTIYQYGAPLPMLIALCLRALSAIFPDRYFDPGDGALTHLLGRAITAVISSSGAFAMYVAARYATPGDRDARLRGIYASVAYAMAAEMISHGRYAVTDADLAALVAWSLAFGALYVRGGRLSWAFCTLAAGAVAVAFKITAGPAMLVPGVVLLARRLALPRRSRIIALALALPVATAIFFALNPNMILHWSKAIADISTRMTQYARGGVPEFTVRTRGPEHLGAIVYALFFQMFHRWPLASAVLASLAFAGTARAIRARSLVTIAGVVHGAVVVVGLAISSRAFLLRNYLVVVPVLCLGLSFAMEWVHERARARGRLVPVAIAAAFAAFFVAVPCAQAAETERLATDPRERAIDWIAAHAKRQVDRVACTPDAIVDGPRRPELWGALARPNLAILADADSPERVRDWTPDWVLVVAHPDLAGRGEMFPFTSVPGYRDVAHFDANPYEHNFDVTPTWYGRFSVIVLERE